MFTSRICPLNFEKHYKSIVPPKCALNFKVPLKNRKKDIQKVASEFIQVFGFLANYVHEAQFLV